MTKLRAAAMVSKKKKAVRTRHHVELFVLFVLPFVLLAQANSLGARVFVGTGIPPTNRTRSTRVKAHDHLQEPITVVGSATSESQVSVPQVLNLLACQNNFPGEQDQTLSRCDTNARDVGASLVLHVLGNNRGPVSNSHPTTYGLLGRPS